MKAGRDDFKPFHLYVFEAHIMAFQTVEIAENQKDNQGKVMVDIFGNAKQTFRRKNKYYSLYEIKNFNLIHVKERNLIELAAFKNGFKLREKSLEIRFEETENLPQALSEYVEKINKLKEEANPQILPSSSHSGHEYEFFKNSVSFVDGVIVDENERDHVICGVCNNFLGGKIFTGVYCTTCNKYFHVGCFEKEPTRGDTGALQLSHQPAEVSSTSPSHWDMGKISEREAKRLLRDKRRGTFLVRFSGRKGNYYLNTNNPGREVRKILNVDINGQEYFYTKEGFSYRTIQELIDQNRGEYNLLFPVGCEESNMLDEDDRDEEQIEDIIEEENLNHGDISREEAERRLKNGDPSKYFLIRSNEDGYKLSYYTPTERIGHLKILPTDDGGFVHNKQARATQVDYIFLPFKQYICL